MSNLERQGCRRHGSPSRYAQLAHPIRSGTRRAPRSSDSSGACNAALDGQPLAILPSKLPSRLLSLICPLTDHPLGVAFPAIADSPMVTAKAGAEPNKPCLVVRAGLAEASR